jgi:hypothetical protein
MKHAWLALLFCLFFSQVADAQSVYFADYGDSLQIWLNLRVENARKGLKETVEMPLVVRSTGWGCMCPDHYIGVSPLTQEGPWISPIVPEKFPVSDSMGYSLVVKGFFTGKMKKIDLRNEAGEPADWLYTVPLFKITSWKNNSEEYSVDAPKVIHK